MAALTRLFAYAREHQGYSGTGPERGLMVTLGIVLLLLGYVFGIAPLVTIGWILLLAGAIAWALGAAGRPVFGRRNWY